MKKLIRRGNLCVHCPRSGQEAYHCPRPDIICVKNGRAIAIDVKVRTKPVDLYIKRRDIQRYELIRNVYGLPVYVCVSIEGSDWMCIDPFKPDKVTKTLYIYRRETIFSRHIPIDFL